MPEVFSDQKLSSQDICIFISYCTKDRTYAKYLAEALKALSVKVYFDWDDKELEKGLMHRDDTVIVKCIEEGLKSSTHLLGLITPNTRDSWWVPFEIGHAKGMRKPCVHTVTADVEELPSFIKTSEVILNQQELISWVKGLTPHAEDVLHSYLKTHHGYENLNGILPIVRQPDQFKYY